MRAKLIEKIFRDTAYVRMGGSAEERRAAEEIQRRAERIAAMKRKLNSTGVGIEEYVITLEKQLKALEGESKRAEELALEVDRLQEVEKQQLNKIEALNSEIEELKQTIINERQRHFEEIEALKKEHEDAMHALVVKHEAEMYALKQRHANEMMLLREQHQEEIRSLQEGYENTISDLRTLMQQREDDFRSIIRETKEKAEAEIAALKTSHAERLSELNAAVENANATIDQLLNAKRIAEARLKAAIGVDRDLTDRDSFNELEHEFNAFRQLYKEQWAKTKKQIRKNHINHKNIKGQAENTEDSE